MTQPDSLEFTWRDSLYVLGFTSLILIAACIAVGFGCAILTAIDHFIARGV